MVSKTISEGSIPSTHVELWWLNLSTTELSTSPSIKHWYENEVKELSVQMIRFKVSAYTAERCIR